MSQCWFRKGSNKINYTMIRWGSGWRMFNERLLDLESMGGV